MMLKLQQIGPNQWRFIEPEGYEKVYERFYVAWDSLSWGGDVNDIRSVLQEVLSQCPDHLGARGLLAQIYEDAGDLLKAKVLLEEAVALGRKAFPPEFRKGDLLEWIELSNRSFLRCLHHLGLIRQQEGKMEEALSIYQEILSFNPNDNQGVRSLAIEVLFALKRPADVLSVCKRYHEDFMPEVIYGKALALFQLERRTDAAKVLREAIWKLPRVAEELVKSRHRRPKSVTPLGVTYGGADEAYEYWKRNGRIWKQTPGALDWLKEIFQNLPQLKMI